MKLSILIILLTVLIGNGQLGAQLLEKSKIGFKLDSIHYQTNEEILNFLVGNSEAQYFYQQSERNKRNAQILGTTSMIAIAAVPVFIVLYPNPNGDSPNGEYLAMAMISGISSIFTGILGISFLRISNKNKEQVVRSYNYKSNQIGQSSRKTNFNVSWNITNEGVGICFSF